MQTPAPGNRDRRRVAEDRGFEPLRAVNPTRFPSERHRPLGESSAGEATGRPALRDEIPPDLGRLVRGGSHLDSWATPRAAASRPTPPGPEGSKGSELCRVRGGPFLPGAVAGRTAAAPYRLSERLVRVQAWKHRSPSPAIRALFLPLHVQLRIARAGGDGTRATMVPTVPAGDGNVNLAVTLDPPRAAQNSEWFEVLSWQGRERLRTPSCARSAPAASSPTEPVPVDGNWNTLLRLAHGPHLMAMSVRQHPVPQSGGPRSRSSRAAARWRARPSSSSARRPAGPGG